MHLVCVQYNVTIFGCCVAILKYISTYSFIVYFCLSLQSSLIVILKLALLFCYSTGPFHGLAVKEKARLLFANFFLLHKAKFGAHLMFC